MIQKYLLLFTLLLLINTSVLQAGKVVLLEEATSATCSPCAYYNPGLQEFVSNHFGGVVTVRYHAWWPTANPLDPMYLLNPTDNQNRIYYYYMNSVPNYAVDGTLYGAPSDPALIKSQMLERLMETAPAQINIRTTSDYDSLHTEIELIPLTDLSSENLVLRAAIIERMVTFVSAPASNGEKEFADVMRKLLPSGDGTALTSFNIGDTLRYNFDIAMDSQWIPEDLNVVAWLQDDSNLEVLQAAIDFPTAIIESTENNFKILAADTTIEMPYIIKNDHYDPLNLKLSFKNVSNGNSWLYQINHDGNKSSTLETQIAAGDSLLFTVDVTSQERGSLSFTLFAENLSDPAFYGEGYGYGYSKDFTAVVPENNDILLVDDDGGADYEQNFETILKNNGIRYVTLAQNIVSIYKEMIDFNAYQLVIWNVSWNSPAFSAQDIETITTYLDGGGNLMVLGQDIGWDIFDDEGSSNFTESQDFYHNYLGAEYVADNSGGTSVTGVESDPISEDLSFSLDKPYGTSSFYPEQLDSYENKAQIIFNYNNGTAGAVRYDSGTFRTVYLGFGLEQINGSDNREAVLMRTLEWTAGLTNISGSRALMPKSSALFQNYPNPFNPQTEISYQLANDDFVELTVYNILGKKIQTLVKSQQKAGNHNVLFNGKDLSSGLYFYTLKTSQSVFKRKMVLLK